MNHAGQVAIITGGGWNIGRAVALALARSGYHAVLAARNPERLEETCRRIEADGGKASIEITNVTDPAQTEALVARTLERHGRLDALVNLAGGFGAEGAVDAVAPEAWIDVIHRNLVGTFLVTRAALPALRRQETAHIVNCAGAGAFFPQVGAAITAYACAKAALCRFTDQLASELLDTGIRVNCVEPGMVWDPLTLRRIEAEEKRTGRPHPDRVHLRPPEAAAELVLFLVSEAATTINGRLVSVNDTWWRDPREIARVAGGDGFRLRRSEG